jgi:chromosome segregation ATPase
MEEIKNREYFSRKGFQVGSIVRVAMRNFLTYDDAIAFPGPQLNVVLGPNGSGKSALTHAICLACGGAPKSIGRSDDITQFVKRGKEKEGISFCEVDILGPENIRTVRRIINSETRSSKWTMNGRSTTQADVKAFMKSLHIDVDNLCSFMPQDKVGTFTHLSPQGILEKTLQSITVSDDRTLYDEQIELANYQKQVKTREDEVKAKEDTVKRLREELEQMQSEVDRMRQRTQLEDLLNLYRVKLVVVKAGECEQLIKEKQV